MMRTQIRNHRPPLRRRGVAMLLVLGVVGIAAVLGYAMLASASLQRQVSANSAATVGAQGMAESGVNLAMYYLQWPGEWKGFPATYPQSEEYDRNGLYWTGTGGQFVEVGSPAVGSVKVSVVRSDPDVRWQYDIEAVGRAAGSSVERKVKATVWVNAEFKVKDAASFTNDVTLTAGSRAGVSGQGNGNVYSNGGLVIRSTAAVYGSGVRRKTVSSPVTPTSGWKTAPVVPQVVPKNLSEIRSYLEYESPAGTVRNGQVLSITAIGDGQAVPRLEPTASNPAGIYYAPGNFTIKGNGEVRGTLIVQGNLNIDGANTKVQQALSGFPALLVGGDVSFINLVGASNLTVTGLAWVGGRVDALALTPVLNVNGSLMVGGTTPIFPVTLGGKVNLTFDPATTVLPDFSEIGRSAVSVKILSWQSQ